MTDWRAAAGLSLACLLVAGVSRASDGEAGAEGIIDDVERIVSVEETTSDWFLDEEHQTRIHSAVLRSLCLATPSARRAAFLRAISCQS